MASQVNPFNVDGTYPVAGQDNDSQGFRDNFTNTRNNFAFIKQEIEDLQGKAVVKSPLSNTTLDNNMGFAVTQNSQLKSYALTYNNIGNAAATQQISFANGNFQRFGTVVPTILTFASTWPVNGIIGRIELLINVTSATHTITWPAAVSLADFPSSSYAVNSSQVTTFSFPPPATTGFYLYDIFTSNAGVNIYASLKAVW